MSSGRHLAPLILLVLVLIGAGCASLDSPSLAVLRLYQAIQAQDVAAYRASLDPSLRSQPNPFFLLDALRFGAGLEGIGLGIDLGQFTKLSFRDLHYRIQDRVDDRAHVRVQGMLRLAGLGVEVPFCDVHLVSKIEGRWLVTYDEADHTAKVDRWQQRWSQLMQELDPSNVGGSLEGMLDFCQ